MEEKPFDFATQQNLIKLVHGQPDLYDPNSLNYKKNVKRALIWEGIGKKLNKTGEACRLEWARLKKGYDYHKKKKTNNSKRPSAKDSLETEKKEILNRLANSRKEDVKALAKKTNRDKDEINRIKREIHSQSVERGVAECCRLEQKYATRREQLARTHDRLLQLLLKHRDQELVELERMCGGAPEG
ncbi:hypothetical protein PYW08_002368 [Mythimna loreyi]|uniref:Uncharacterized protein n=1 Tax=Mythimna loreyi TaxID=667449 RepID=A0ACC2R2I8_9NEOP|nr:hypothetical protein PYW08_002368 [Mythimna loreyi]